MLKAIQSFFNPPPTKSKGKAKSIPPGVLTDIINDGTYIGGGEYVATIPAKKLGGTIRLSSKAKAVAPTVIKNKVTSIRSTDEFNGFLLSTSWAMGQWTVSITKQVPRLDGGRGQAASNVSRQISGTGSIEKMNEESTKLLASLGLTPDKFIPATEVSA